MPPSQSRPASDLNHSQPYPQTTAAAAKSSATEVAAVRAQPERATVPPSARSPSLAPAIMRLIEKGKKFPKASEINALSDDEQSALIDAYRRIDSITNKMGIAWTLAYAGDSNAVNVLMHTLFEEYRGRQFDFREGATLKDLPWFLGMAADRDRRVLEMLQAGTSPDYWRSRVTWSGAHQDVNESLARSAIKGLAQSTQPEAWKTILNLVSNPPPWFTQPYRSSVVGAAYNREMIALHGREWYWENCPGDFNRMHRWSTSESGRPWREWEQRELTKRRK